MTQELVYTSVARGLKAGSRGFCVAAATPNLSPITVSMLESLSAYRHLNTPTGGPHPGNPVAYSHLHLPGEGKSILSRIADAGLDYSGRTNKVAHHVVLEHGERSDAGPAAVLAIESNWMTAWTGEPRTLPPRKLSPGRDLTGPCATWQSVSGDAGWAGELARSGSSRARAIIVPAGVNALALVDEAMSVVPPADRWRIAFTTFDNGLPQGVQCHWRFAIAGTAEHQAILKSNPAGLIDLTGPLGRAPDSPQATIARSGDRSSLPATRRPASRSVGSRSGGSVADRAAAFAAKTSAGSDEIKLAPPPLTASAIRAKSSVSVAPVDVVVAPPKRPRRSRGKYIVIGLLAMISVLSLLAFGGAAVWYGYQKYVDRPPVKAMSIDEFMEVEPEVPKPEVPEPEMDRELVVEHEDTGLPGEPTGEAGPETESNDAPSSTENMAAVSMETEDKEATSKSEDDNEIQEPPAKEPPPPINLVLTTFGQFQVPDGVPKFVATAQFVSNPNEPVVIETFKKLELKKDKLIEPVEGKNQSSVSFEVRSSTAIYEIKEYQIEPSKEADRSQCLLWRTEENKFYLIMPNPESIELSVLCKSEVKSELGEEVLLGESGPKEIELPIPFDRAEKIETKWVQEGINKPKHSQWDDETETLEREWTARDKTKPTMTLSLKPMFIPKPPNATLSASLEGKQTANPEPNMMTTITYQDHRINLIEIAFDKNNDNGLAGKTIDVSLHVESAVIEQGSFRHDEKTRSCMFKIEDPVSIANGKMTVDVDVDADGLPNWTIEKLQPGPDQPPTKTP